LDPYYAAFHGMSQRENLTLDEPAPGRVATWYYAAKTWGQLDEQLTAPVALPDADGLTAKEDDRALEIFAQHLRTIIALCERQHVRPIFIPQVLNCAALVSDTPYGWAPFIRDRDLCDVNRQYGATLMQVAAAGHVSTIDEV